MRRMAWALSGFALFGALELLVYWGAPRLYFHLSDKRLMQWIEERQFAHAAGSPAPYRSSVFDRAAGTWIPQREES